jgi:hypothetical protein
VRRIRGRQKETQISEIKVEALEIIAYLKSEGVEGVSAASYIEARESRTSGPILRQKAK